MNGDALAQIQARLDGGDGAGAVSLASRLLDTPGLPPADRLKALVLRSRAFEAGGDLPRATGDIEAALALDPRQARLWNELGLLHGDAGEVSRAIAAFERATVVDPRYARAFSNLGNALRSADRVAEAIVAAERAVGIDPGYALAWSNLGVFRREVGDDRGAEEALRRAVTLNARQPGAWLALGNVLKDRSDLEAAADAFARAAMLDARDANACFQLGAAVAERDRLPAARDAFAEAERRDPALLRATIARALVLPMLADDVVAVGAARDTYTRGLTHLEDELPRKASSLAPERVIEELRWTNFLLAYQGRDDRDLQARYGTLAARLLHSRAPDWVAPIERRASRHRVKVGFVSAFLRDGTAGRYFESWITDLPREEFEVHVYHLLPGIDALGQRIAFRADVFRHLPWWKPSRVAPVVRADGLDILVYPELGMGAVPFALASLRLAPVQCAGWGHPVTTGLPEIDVFLSCASMEPSDAQAHYTERLVTLPGIGTRYRMPSLPPPATRAQLGLPDGLPLLLCPQSLFKVHPDNDRLFARVLGAIPQSQLVMFQGRDPDLTRRLSARLARAGVDVRRLRMLPQCAHDDFLRINGVCDVMLDTLHWSGGNTSLDALASGLPIVTLPGQFMRGRQSAAMLAAMGLSELVAADLDDYVRQVAQVATDAGYRLDIAGRLRAARGAVFDTAAPAQAFAQRLRELSAGG